MLINFQHSDSAAIKVAVNGINAVSGLPQADSPPHSTEQDYLLGDARVQPWLETITVSPGVTQQVGGTNQEFLICISI